MDIYKKSFTSVKCLGLDDILAEVCDWLISLGIGFTSYITSEVIEAYSTSTTNKQYELKYYILKNANLGADIAFTDKYLKVYTDSTFTTLSSIDNSREFGIHRIYSEDNTNLRNTNQRISIRPNCSSTSYLVTDTFFWKVNMSVYVKDKNNIVITYEDGTDTSGTLLGCSLSVGSGLVICSCGDEQYFLYKPAYLGNSISGNTVIGSDTSLWYGFPQFYKGRTTNTNSYMVNCRISGSDSSVCTDEKILDYIYETNASNLINGEFYTINNKEYLCFSAEQGLLMEC